MMRRISFEGSGRVILILSTLAWAAMGFWNRGWAKTPDLVESQDSKLGMGWRDPSGLFWSELIRDPIQGDKILLLTQSDAREYCGTRRAELPRSSHLKEIADALMRLPDGSERIWTDETRDSSSYVSYVFDGKTAQTDVWAYWDDLFPFRCIRRKER